MTILPVVIASEAKQSSLLFALDCRVAALLAMTLLSAGCASSNGDEIEACRGFLQGGLRSPSTYQEFSVQVSDGEDIGQFDRRNVFIEYDAANAFGTPIRGTQLCSFEIDKKTKKLVYKAKPAAVLSSVDRTLGRGDGGCCVPYKELDPNDPAANMTFLDNNMDAGQ
ncbi:MAG: hypothetical protein H0W65_05750 [Sphingomonas sp.]|uniref:hypothetical protein n=1 Tax=Sphingomonas sp. TaxID=28214 RepID=UPI0018310574|nr:hypothetical protein [Sphingomonas sp.]MBA3667207.1 hypothetical protein [Sphingomonas sp.]